MASRDKSTTKPKTSHRLPSVPTLILMGVLVFAGLFALNALTGRAPSYPNAKLLETTGPDIRHYYRDLWIVFFYTSFETANTPGQVYAWYKEMGWSPYVTTICGETLMADWNWRSEAIDVSVFSSISACDGKDGMTHARVLRDYHICLRPCSFDEYAE